LNTDCVPACRVQETLGPGYHYAYRGRIHAGNLYKVRNAVAYSIHMQRRPPCYELCISDEAR
jgi:hypothetical protein